MIYQREIWRYSGSLLGCLKRVPLLPLRLILVTLLVYHAVLLLLFHAYLHTSSLGTCFQGRYAEKFNQIVRFNDVVSFRGVPAENYERIVDELQLGVDLQVKQAKKKAEMFKNDSEQHAFYTSSSFKTSETLDSNCFLLYNFSSAEEISISKNVTWVFFPSEKLVVHSRNTSTLIFKRQRRLIERLGAELQLDLQLIRWRTAHQKFLQMYFYTNDHLQTLDDTSFGFLDAVDAIFILFFLSAFSSLFVHFATAYLLPLLWLLFHPHSFFNDVPWLGIYLNANATFSQKIRLVKSMAAASLSILVMAMFSLYYYVPLTVRSSQDFKEWKLVMLMVAAQTLNNIFTRAKLTILFLPRAVIFSFFIFIYYNNHFNPRFTGTAFQILVWALLSIYLHFLPVEQARAKDYPREMFLAGFNSSWTMELSQEWTIFAPLYDIKDFDEQQIQLL